MQLATYFIVTQQVQTFSESVGNLIKNLHNTSSGPISEYK